MLSVSNKPIISILVPVYNVEQFLEACIHSIIQQIDDRTEVIFCNDASTDGSLNILKRYASNDRIKILDLQKNIGVSGVRNQLLQAATGEYIWFIDADDLVVEGIYQHIIDTLKVTSVDMLCGDYYYLEPSQTLTYGHGFIGRANKTYYNKNGRFMKVLTKLECNYLWIKIMKRELFDNITFLEGKIFEDIYFFTTLSTKNFTYLYLKKPFIKYRINPNSLVHVKSESYVDDYFESILNRFTVLSQDASQQVAKKSNKHGYLAYKTFSTYINFLESLYYDKNFKLLNYAMNNYDALFIKLLNNHIDTFNFFEKRNVSKKLKQHTFFWQMYPPSLNSINM